MQGEAFVQRPRQVHRRHLDHEGASGAPGHGVLHALLSTELQNVPMV